LKAKNAEHADALIAQALAAPHERLACRYMLVGESIRAKLSPNEKKRFAADLASALAEAPTPREIINLIYNASQQHVVHDEKYVGQLKQEKTILKFLDAMQFDAFSEAEIESLLRYLRIMSARKPWLNCLNHARRRFLKNPAVRLSFVAYYLDDRTTNMKTHLAREHLDAARRLVGDMPRGEGQQKLLEEIREHEDLIVKIEAHHRSMMDVFDRVFGNSPSEDDYDD
jgi:hypothetical protein